MYIYNKICKIFLYKKMTLCGIFLVTIFATPIAFAETPLPLPVISLSVNRLQITRGESATLSWTSSNAYTCTSSGSWSGRRETSGSYVIQPNSSSTYKLTCWNSAGKSTSDSVTISVQQIPFPQVTFSANPTSINRGDSSLISWSATNADRCTASGGWSGNWSASGTVSVTPINYTGYTITCSNSLYKVSRSVNVRVLFITGTNIRSSANITPGVVDVVLTAIPQTITPGQSSKLNWGATNVNSCYASGAWSGTKLTYDTQIVSPNTSSNYVLTCSNGTNLKTVTATVIVDGTSQGSNTASSNTSGGNLSSSNKPTLFFIASSTIIKRGEITSLSWQSNNTTLCTASGGWSGSRPLNGKWYIWPNAQTNYTLTCLGPNGTVSASALVSVTNPVSIINSTSITNNALITSSLLTLKAYCSVSSYSVQIGDKVTLNATAKNGKAPYTYVWSGAISKIGPSQEISFSTTGTKVATVSISDSFGKTAYVNCSVKVVPRTVAIVSPSPLPPSSITNIQTTSTTQITLPSGEVLSLAGTCTVQNMVMCSDGKVYSITNNNGDVTDSNSKIVYNDNTLNTITNTDATTSTSKTDVNISSKSFFASIFFNDNDRLSGFGLLLIVYIFILLVIAFIVLVYRFLHPRSSAQDIIT